MGWMDEWFPGRAARRAELRVKKIRADLQAQLLERRFEGAAGGRRNDGWRSTGSDANAENGPALARLRNRARDLRRNNPYAERAITGIADNVVGAGIVPKPLAKSSRANKRLVALWQQWAESLACDADGLENFYGLQHKIVEAVVEGGEVLIRRRRRKSSDGLPVPIQLQVLEPDFLDELKNGAAEGDNLVIQGIEFDANGRRVAYWLFDEHPGSNITWRGLSSKRVPASDVIHVFLPRRAGQARGYTWFAPVMQRLRGFDEMEDAVMEQAKIAACFAAFVTKDDNAVAAGKRPALVERVEPGIIQELAGGESVSFGTPPAFNGYTTYAWQGLHAISVGLGVPYELLTGDLKGVNFSSGRMGWLNFARRVDVWQWRMLIPQLCDGVWAWFMEAQALVVDGAVLEPAKAEWTPPRRDMVDPKTETDNVVSRVRNGLTSWSDALREMGVTDPEAHAKKIADDNKLIDSQGLVLDCDPRKVAAAGAATQPPPTEEEKPEDAEANQTDGNPDA